MTTEIQTTPDPATLKSKRKGWADVGELIYTTEIALSHEAEKVIALLPVTPPVGADQVNAQAATLEEVKQLRNMVEQKRKSITNKFREVADRLMIPEKKIDQAIAGLTSRLVSAKQVIESERRANEQRDQILKDYRMQLANAKAKFEGEYKSKVAEILTASYSHALDKIDPEALEAYLKKVAVKLKAVPRWIAAPESTTEGAEAVKVEIWKFDDRAMLDMCHADMMAKYSDYAVAYLNKKDAQDRNAKEAAEKAAAIKAEEERKELAAKMEAASAPEAAPQVHTKALRKSYEIDMPETVESAMAILGAFVANADKCLPKLRIAKWFGFTPKAAAGALSKVKSDDNAFAPTGLTWKEVDKL